LIMMRKMGRSILYSPNKGNFLLRELLIPLFNKEKHVLDSVGKTILSSISHPKPISMVLFGSQAVENKARPDSDFDILCIIPDETNLRKFKQEISMAETKIEKKFGNRLSLVVMKKKEFLRRKKGSDSLLLSIEAQNVQIFGKSIREIG